MGDQQAIVPGDGIAPAHTASGALVLWGIDVEDFALGVFVADLIHADLSFFAAGSFRNPEAPCFSQL